MGPYIMVKGLKGINLGLQLSFSTQNVSITHAQPKGFHGEGRGLSSKKPSSNIYIKAFVLKHENIKLGGML